MYIMVRATEIDVVDSGIALGYNVLLTNFVTLKDFISKENEVQNSKTKFEFFFSLVTLENFLKESEV